MTERHRLALAALVEQIDRGEPVTREQLDALRPLTRAADASTWPAPLPADTSGPSREEARTTNPFLAS